MSGLGVEAIFGKIRADRGFHAETKVHRTVQNQIDLRLAPEWLKGIEKATREEEQRGMGVDFWAFTDVGKIPLQIKSSEKGKKSALRKHPEIPVMVVHRQDDPEAVFARFTSLVGEIRNYQLERNDGHH